MLGIEVGERAPAAEVRQAVLALRTAKGMVLAENDHDTWSAGPSSPTRSSVRHKRLRCLTMPHASANPTA